MRTDDEFLERVDFERSRLIDKLADEFKQKKRGAIRVKINYNALTPHLHDYITSDNIDDEAKYYYILPFLVGWLYDGEKERYLTEEESLKYLQDCTENELKGLVNYIVQQVKDRVAEHTISKNLKEMYNKLEQEAERLQKESWAKAAAEMIAERPKRIDFSIYSLRTIEMRGEQAKLFYEKNDNEYPEVGTVVELFWDYYQAVWEGTVVYVDPDEPRIVLELDDDDEYDCDCDCDCEEELEDDED